MKMGWGWPGGGVLVSISTLSSLRLILLIREILTCDWLPSKQEPPGT